MHLSVSQIAWESGKDSAFLNLLTTAGFPCVDIAPTKIWPDWRITDPSPIEYKRMLASRGIACSGMQSIFFGTKGLNLFGDTPSWTGLQAHFGIVSGIAGALGVKAIVFGAPANRDPGENAGDVIPLAGERIGILGDIALREGTCLCLEPVPADLGGRFLRTTAETVDFVRKLAHTGVKINLDTAVLAAEGWNALETRSMVLQNLDVIGHVHASEPQLGPFTAPQALHSDVARALRDGGYKGGVAIEMRAGANTEQSHSNLVAALEYVARAYSLH